MRRVLPFLLALLLGVGAAALVACGDSSTSGGIPATDADELSSAFEDVQQAVDGGRCDGVAGQIRQVEEGLDALSQSAEPVDDELVARLREANARLSETAVDECNEADEAEEEEPVEEEPEVQTQTQETTTTAPPTTTQEPEEAPEEVPPPAEVPPEAPDPGTPPLDEDNLPPEGGGVQPEVVP